MMSDLSYSVSPADGRYRTYVRDLMVRSVASRPADEARPAGQHRVLGQVVLAVRAHTQRPMMESPRRAIALRPGPAPAALYPAQSQGSTCGQTWPAAVRQRRFSRTAPKPLVFCRVGLPGGRCRLPAAAGGTASRWPVCRQGSSAVDGTPAGLLSTAAKSSSLGDGKTASAAGHTVSCLGGSAKRMHCPACTGSFVRDGWIVGVKAVTVTFDGLDQSCCNTRQTQEQPQLAAPRFPAARYNAKRSQHRPP